MPKVLLMKHTPTSISYQSLANAPHVSAPPSVPTLPSHAWPLVTRECSNTQLWDVLADFGDDPSEDLESLHGGSLPCVSAAELNAAGESFLASWCETIGDAPLTKRSPVGPHRITRCERPTKND
jgi:hypothetical protein